MGDRKKSSEFYERKYANGEEFQRSSKTMTLDAVPRGQGLRVLDVGCGSGLNSQRLHDMGHQVTGIDVSEEAIRKYTARGFEGRVMNIEEGLLFDDASFDIVFCSEVIEHLVLPENLLAEAHRVLRPGGTLVLSTPNSSFWLYRLFALLGWTLTEIQHRMHVRFFSKRSLTRLLKDQGFAVERAFGRNMVAILPDRPLRPLHRLMALAGFQREMRFRSGRHFWHLSFASGTANGLLADTLIIVGRK